MSSTDYVIGIDTGGTYTDGVLLDYRTREVLASAKTLTTYQDLALGINKVLGELNIGSPAKVKLVGISSTLATNSIAEGKARRVGLILLGYDQDLIYSYGLDSKFATRNFAFFKGGHNSQGEEQNPPDIEGIKKWILDNKDKMDAITVSSYFSPLNPSHEEQVLEAIKETCSLPVVLGHQLSTKLDSIKRAATASLNASLVAVMYEFIEAVRTSLKDMGLNAPLMIVKGDGSLMPYTEAAQKPIETVLSGPAASSMGGRFLSGQSNVLMIDIGGTTTDMALIEGGQVNVSDQGAKVGEIETAVEAARIRTACLGCDSRITFKSEKEFQVGPDRVMPISRLASLYPQVEKELFNLKNKPQANTGLRNLEYWVLTKEPDPEMVSLKDKTKQDLIGLLRKRPYSLAKILSEMNVHHAVQLNVDELFQQGYLETATLTPTDLLHIDGQIELWNTEAANNALAYIGKIYNKKRGPLIDQVLNYIVKQIVEEAVIFLARQKKETKLSEEIDGTWGRWFFEEALSGKNDYLSMGLASRFPIIGIGAPAELFIKKVAETLHAKFILPPNPHVANAVGAVAGSVIIDKEAIVYVQETVEKRAFIVRFEGETTSFKESEDALEYAKKVAVQTAREAAFNAGAEKPQVEVKEYTEGSLQRIRVRAVGNPKLSEQFHAS